jgi:hypothetical protein
LDDLRVRTLQKVFAVAIRHIEDSGEWSIAQNRRDEAAIETSKGEQIVLTFFFSSAGSKGPNGRNVADR